MNGRCSALRLMVCVLFVLTCLVASAQKKGGNGGILLGDDFGIGFQAPPGWVLDNKSGVNQGLDAVFYPVGQTWKGSPIVAYCRFRPVTDKIKTAADVVRDTLADLHEQGNPHSKATKMAPLKLSLGATAQIYYYTGDSYGNYEAAAYIVEPKTINFFILTSRKKDLFTKSIPAFHALVKSYFLMKKEPDTSKKPGETDPSSNHKKDPDTL